MEDENIGEVAYDFGEGVTAEQTAQYTADAKALGLTAEQAPSYAKFAAAQAEATAKANATPETYSFTKIGDKDVDEATAKDFGEIAKHLGLTQAQAQKFAEYEFKMRSDVQAHVQSDLANTQKAWQGEVAADPEIGGAKLDENRAVAKAALEKFFPDIAKDSPNFVFLDHPGVVRGLVKIGRAISPDGDFVRSGGASEAADPAKVMFPTMA